MAKCTRCGMTYSTRITYCTSCDFGAAARARSRNDAMAKRIQESKDRAAKR